MAEEILMPRLSDTMTEGVIAAWHKKVGDDVKKGDLLAEIETDKATMDLESYKEGTLLYTGGEKGSKIQVNDLLAIIGKKGEDISKIMEKNSGVKKDETVAPKEKTADKKEESPQKNNTPSTEKEIAASSANTGTATIAEEIVLMPRLSDTMTEGVIAAWHKNVGEDVKKGDLLADIETDKATMELESYKNGKLLYQGATAGEKIAVNHLLCIIGSEGFDVEAAVASVKSDSSNQPQTENKEASEIELAKENSGHHEEVVATNNAGNNDDTGVDGRIFISPLAKKMAEEKGIDIAQLKGSGDGGRIVKSDIDHYTIPEKATVEKTVSSEGSQNIQSGLESFDDVPVSQMRAIIAKRLGESKFSAPHFYLTMQINMDAVVSARTRLNELNNTKVSFNDIILKACAIALRKNPKVNSSWLGDKIRYNHHIHIGVAVAVEEGLLVPVIRFADTKPISNISTEVKDFAQKAKDKKLQPKDWEGSTFTISNLGMFGIDEFTAIINPPDACILAVGGIADTPVVKNGAIVPGKIMKVTLSCDHRVVDGATGAAFLKTLKSLLEEPLGLVW